MLTSPAHWETGDGETGANGDKKRHAERKGVGRTNRRTEEKRAQEEETGRQWTGAYTGHGVGKAGGGKAG